MNEYELKYADYCIKRLHESYPKSNTLKGWLDKKEVVGWEKLLAILEDEGWIEPDGLWWKLSSSVLSTLSKHGSYSKHQEYLSEQDDLKKKFDELNVENAKLTRVNLNLQNRKLKRDFIVGILGILVGFILANWKDILIMLQVVDKSSFQ
jgi:hypothetical protein